MGTPIWKPSAERIATANMTVFRRMVAEHIAPTVNDYADLYDWSVRNPEQFWPAVWDFSEVIASRPAEFVLRDGDHMLGAKWFTGARLNYAENLLRHGGSSEAIVFWNEHGRQAVYGFSEITEQAARLAASFRRWGIAPGDRVAGYLPNLPETVIAMLTATSIGAVWTACAPDFGLQGVLDRFSQTEPRVLVTAVSYRYNGKEHRYLDRVRGLLSAVPSIEKTVVVPYLDLPGNADLPPGAVLWEQALAADAAPRYEQRPFDHPIYIVYSSGTTGRPKCIVHGAGGTLLQHAKELLLHTDIKPGDRVFYFTTCGWMMWNWLVYGLAAGATIVLYDGSPLYPAPDALFRLAEEEHVTAFGASAKYLAAIEKAGLEPASRYDLSPLRTLLSTGSPLAPESFEYVYRAIKDDVCLSSISGGTDIISCFALGNPIGPVYRGELQTRGLGLAVEIFDENGRPVRCQKGELVCTKPFPAMPVAFWNDPDREKYHQAYFTHYPNTWRHGDWAELTEHDGIIIYGRSDAVLNPGGVRIGTAEIYRVVEQFPEVFESLVIGQEWDGDVRVILFVRLIEGAELTADLTATIKRQIRDSVSPRHVPAKVIPIADIPRTINNKITELAVRDVVHGRPVRNTEALLNPEALDLFRDLPELSE